MGNKTGKDTMKLLTGVFILSLLSFQMVFAGNAEEAYLKAQAAYQSGDIAKALSLYQSINPKGPAIWYNIGNCYFHQENFPEAIVAWRRAQKNLSWSDYKTTEQYIEQSYNALGIEYGSGSFALFLISFLGLFQLFRYLRFSCFFCCVGCSVFYCYHH